MESAAIPRDDWRALLFGMSSVVLLWTAAVALAF
jgi:hypothetical protein